MLILLSPSKTQEAGHSFSDYTYPEFQKRAAQLVKVLRRLSSNEIRKLMQVSEKLADTTRRRFNDFSSSPNPANSCQALLSFRGDVFSEIEADSFNGEDFTFAQQHLRILSGLYGILRPLDLMQPYRLEMGGVFKPDGRGNLYDFWRQEITTSLKKASQSEKHTELLNLASNEYFKVIDSNTLGLRIVNVFFKQQKNDKLRTIAVHAKKARGALTNYIIKNRLQKSADLTAFTYAGYSFAKNKSTADELMYIKS